MFKIIKEKDGKITLNTDACKGCGLCVNSCKFGALTIDYTDETINNVINRMENLIEYE